MIKIILLAFGVFLTMLGSAQTDMVKDSLVVDTTRTFAVDSLLEYAEKFIGRPYGFGSTGPSSFDCSGYVQFVYRRFGVVLPHGSTTQSGLCKTVELKDAQPGDLIFFNGRKRNGLIGHVAIVHHWEGDQLYIIHATVQAGVLLENMHQSAYFKPRFVRVGRLPDAVQKDAQTIPKKKS